MFCIGRAFGAVLSSYFFLSFGPTAARTHLTVALWAESSPEVSLIANLL
jgi:hypothetical protein